MKLYKYYRPAEYAFISLKDQTVCFNSMANFTDPMEGRYKMISEPELALAHNAIEEIINNATNSLANRLSDDYTDLIRFKFRVLSVTDDCLYSYMWKEYADNGAGFCVEYDSDDLEKCSDAGARMNYTDVKDPNGVFQNPDDTVGSFNKAVQEILFSKICNHENNFRLEHEIRYVLSVPVEDRIEVDIQEYLDKHLGTEKDKNDTYFAEFTTRKHYKAKNIFLRDARVRKVMIGYNASEETKTRIRKISKTIGVEYEYMTEEMIKADDTF